MALGVQGPNAPTVLTPPARDSYVKVAKLAAGESTAFAAFGIPKNAFISGVYTISMGANSGITVSAGFSATATDIAHTVSVDSTGYAAVSGSDTGSAVGTQLTADKLVYVYASSALTSAVYLKVEYYIPPIGQAF